MNELQKEIYDFVEKIKEEYPDIRVLAAFFYPLTDRRVIQGTSCIGKNEEEREMFLDMLVCALGPAVAAIIKGTEETEKKAKACLN